MAIAPLPQATIHLLGSAQALTTPLSLVKELIDNSLDAKATSVDILISQNTLDKIEVRDNGQGIPHEDLDALGRRGHTSKLRSFEELRTIGGISLGFRGEALASAVQLGDVSVTTKTDGEPVATCVRLKAPGGIASQTRTSHPVGTTVTVKNFISNVPVRKQTALKAAGKTLTKIKELLQAYALARPTIRFSIKVIKESKGSWSYAPRQSDGIRGAVSQIIGRDAAAECIERSLVFPNQSSSGMSLLDGESDEFPLKDANQAFQPSKGQFHIDVFLPKPTSAGSKVSHGQYLSIDSRPVSHEKGTMRKIVTLFKSHIKGSMTDSSEKIKNPFLRMNLECPTATYDPNVEPAKDDVLFENEGLILERIETLFLDVYGTPQEAKTGTMENLPGRNKDDFELLLARTPTVRVNGIVQPPSSSQDLTRHPNPTISSLASPIPHSTVQLEQPSILQIKAPTKDDSHHDEPRVVMSKDLSEEIEEHQPPRTSKRFRPPGAARDANDQGTIDISADLNPWVIAKMNAPVRRSTSPDDPTQLHNLHRRQTNQPKHDLPRTPHFSSPSPMPRLDGRRECVSDNRIRRVSNPAHIVELRSPTIEHPDAPLQEGHNARSASQKHRRSRSFNDEEVNLGEDANLFIRRNEFISARNLAEASLLSPPVDERRAIPGKRVGLGKPFVSPLQNVKNIQEQGNLRQVTLSVTRVPPPVQLIDPVVSVDSLNSDVNWAMRYEHQKEGLNRHLGQEQKKRPVALPSTDVENNADDDIIRSSPHKNRYNAAIVRLGAPSTEATKLVDPESYTTNLEAGDPRNYLMQRQRIKSLGLPHSRTKSSRLPLEKIPETERLHGLALDLNTSLDDIKSMVYAWVIHDDYVASGTLAIGLSSETADGPEIIKKLRTVTASWNAGETHST